jgi:hypothetical protein
VVSGICAADQIIPKDVDEPVPCAETRAGTDTVSATPMNKYLRKEFIEQLFAERGWTDVTALLRAPPHGGKSILSTVEVVHKAYFRRTLIVFEA